MSDGLEKTESSQEAPTSCLTDPVILKRCRSGDNLAWNRVYTEAVSVITGRALRMGFTRSEAEDVCQETLVALANEIDTVKNPAAFIRSVGYRRCVDRIRRQRPTVEYSESESAEEDASAGWMAVRDQLFGEWIQQTRENETAADMLEAADMLKTQLDGMGDPCRKLITIRFCEDQSYESVANLTKLPPGQVGVYLKRCLARLKKTLKADKKLWTNMMELWTKAGSRA